MNFQEQRLMLTLIRDRRWAVLATQGPDGPDASWVTYVPEPDCSGFLLHLSTLSAHTRNLLAHPRAGLAISEPERDDEDPQTLARVTVQGEIAIIPRDRRTTGRRRCAIRNGCPMRCPASSSAISCCYA